MSQDVFDRIDLEWAIMRASETGRADVDPPADLEGRVEKGEVQLLLADAGEIMTKARVSTNSHNSHFSASLLRAWVFCAGCRRLMSVLFPL